MRKYIRKKKKKKIPVSLITITTTTETSSIIYHNPLCDWSMPLSHDPCLLSPQPQWTQSGTCLLSAPTVWPMSLCHMIKRTARWSRIHVGTSIFSKKKTKNQQTVQSKGQWQKKKKTWTQITYSLLNCYIQFPTSSPFFFSPQTCQYISEYRCLFPSPSMSCMPTRSQCLHIYIDFSPKVSAFPGKRVS